MNGDGPEEREFDANEAYERDIDDADVAEQLADEARSNAPMGNWLFQPGVDSMSWPTPIIKSPVALTAPEFTDEKLIALARQRLAMMETT